MTKNALKAIVKECLVEILTEGLSAPQEASALHEAVSSPRRKRQSRPARPALDNVKFEAATKATVDTLTSDPLMASIFEDTLSGTLQEQMTADRPGHAASVAAHGDAAAQAVSQHDPDELFGEAAANWANIAFAGAGPTPQ